jgi:hypothetical protein
MSNVMKEDDNSDDELTIVEDQSQLRNSDDQDDGEDDRPRIESSSDDGDEERDGIRERRRIEKVERKDRRDKAITRDKTEMDFLRKRNDELERRFGAIEQRSHASELSGFDTQIQNARQEVEMAERVIAKAVSAGNGDDVSQAMRYRDQAMAKEQQLNYAKQSASDRSAPKAQTIDDRTMRHAQEFISENKWYDAQGRDEDSAIILAIDQGLMRDGFNPQTEDYWDELRLRAARRLPERFEKSNKADSNREERSPRGGPSISSGREHAPSSTRKEVYISPERKQALLDAGVWDDPHLRQRYVKRYAEYDKQNRS